MSLLPITTIKHQRRYSEPLPVAYQSKSTNQFYFPFETLNQEFLANSATKPVYYSSTKVQLLRAQASTVPASPHATAVLSTNNNNNTIPEDTIHVLNTLVETSNKKSSVSITRCALVFTTYTFYASIFMIAALPIVWTGATIAIGVLSLACRLWSVNKSDKKNMDLFQNIFNENKEKLNELATSNHVLASDMKNFISFCEKNMAVHPGFEQSLLYFRDSFRIFISDIERDLKSIAYRAQEINNYEECEKENNKKLFVKNFIKKINSDINSLLLMPPATEKESETECMARLIYRDCQLLQNISQLRNDNTPIFEQLIAEDQSSYRKYSVERIITSLSLLNVNNSVKF